MRQKRAWQAVIATESCALIVSEIELNDGFKQRSGVTN